jgi:hypothetical protein
LGNPCCSSPRAHYLGWHSMFQILTIVPLLQGLLPQFPWTHSKEEALKVASTICNMQMPSLLQPTPWTAHILLKCPCLLEGLGNHCLILQREGLGTTFSNELIWALHLGHGLQ